MSKQTPTGTGVSPPALTVDQAASAFGAMLNPPQAGKPEGDEEQPGAEAAVETEGAENAAVETDDEASGSDAEETGEEAGDAEEQTEGGEETEQAPPAETTFTVRVDGKDEQVSQSELIAGYSRTSDYTRKTQALSQERKAFTAEQELVRAERQEYSNLLPKLRAALEQAPGAKKPDPALRETDPQAYLLQKAAYDEHMEAVAQINRQEQQAAHRAEQDRKAQIERVAVEQHNLLMKALPTWRDQKVADAEGEMIVDALRSVGFSGKELEIFDHRAILMARMAALYMKSQAKGKEVAPKLKSAPVVKPGAAPRTPKPGDRAKQDLARLGKTGSVRDAATVFGHLFK